MSDIKTVPYTSCADCLYAIDDCTHINCKNRTIMFVHSDQTNGCNGCNNSEFERSTSCDDCQCCSRIHEPLTDNYTPKAK